MLYCGMSVEADRPLLVSTIGCHVARLCKFKYILCGFSKCLTFCKLSLTAYYRDNHQFKYWPNNFIHQSINIYFVLRDIQLGKFLFSYYQLNIILDTQNGNVCIVMQLLLFIQVSATLQRHSRHIPSEHGYFKLMCPNVLTKISNSYQTPW